MKRSKSFSARLSIDIIVVTSILFLAAIIALSLFSMRIIAEEATNSAQNLANSTISRIEKALVSVEATVKESAWLVSEQRENDDRLYHITTKQVEENEYIIGSAVAFDKYYRPGEYYYSPYSYLDPESGKVETKQLGNPQYDYFFMDWFQIPYLTGEPCWSEPYFDEGGAGSMMSTYSYPLKDEDGKVYAILTADISLDWISEFVDSIRPYENSHLAIISRGGLYINLDKVNRRMGETLLSSAIEMNDINAVRIAKDLVSGNSGVRQFGDRKNPYFNVYGHMENGWAVMVICSYRDVLASSVKMQGRALLVGLAALLVLFLITYLIVRKLTKPLESFTESALEIAGGNFNTELPDIHSEDEIRKLRDSFDYMQGSLRKYIDDLKASTAANMRYESELNIASAIQMNLLPKDFPDTPDIALHAFVKPAKEVGGDLYDFKIKDGYLYFLIGDVSGKGVPAALVMSITKEAFNLLDGMNLELDTLVSYVNDAVSADNKSGMFVTLFVGRLDLETGKFEYCNAGHNPAVILGPDGSARYLDVKPNIALGVFDGFPYQKQSMQLDRGTRILLYTDGVTEAERADKAQYGEARLLSWAEQAGKDGDDPRQACDALVNDVRSFTEGNEQNDDITIMTIKYKQK